MNVSKKMMGAVTASLLLLAMVPASANAFALSKTFDFFGKCDDCAGDLVGMDRGMFIDGMNIGGEMFIEEYLYTLFMLPLRETGDGIFQNVSGTLELQNFNPGAALDASNFVSFTYNGSSILDPFTINMGDLNTLSGVLDADGNVLTDVSMNWNATGSLSMICGPTCNLNVMANGLWSIGPLSGLFMYALDVGESGTFAGAPIPEPGTLALFGLGLLGLGLARRRKAA